MHTLYFLMHGVLVATTKSSRIKPKQCYLANGAIAPLSHTGQNVVLLFMYLDI